VVFGVCGGLADYVQVDAALVRCVFAIAALWGGAGLLLYIVLAVVLPTDLRDDRAPVPISLERTQLLTGVVLIALGGLLLVSNAGIAPWLTWNLFWPSLVILLGVGLVAGGRASENRR
jgi:phage shock protein C